MVRKSINKSIVKGAKIQTVKGRRIRYWSITKPAMNRHRHRTENQLIDLSSFSGIMFLNRKAEIAPIKMNTMIIASIGLTRRACRSSQVPQQVTVRLIPDGQLQDR